MSRWIISVFVAAALFVAPASLCAQEDSRDQRQNSDSTGDNDANRESTWSFWLRGNAQLYENFFQAPEGGDEEDVLAGFGEVGAGLRLSRAVPLQLYGQFNYTHYDFENLDSSTGVRIGLRSDGRPHSFDVFAEQLSDRPSFDVGDEFDRADIRTFAGEYSYRVTRQWQLSLDGEAQEQEFDLTPTRDNDYGAFGAAVRWRPTRLFSPEIGYRTGERDVVDETLSYDQSEWYLQVRSSLTPAVYLSVRLRDRTREYSTDAVTSSNFGREDDRQQIAAALDWTMRPGFIWNFYASHEDVETNVEGRDFDTRLYVAGLTLRR